MTPTPEQLACIEAATSTTDNLLISALAGAAKTSTLVLIAEALPETRILTLAFNKKIAQEMQQRLPPNCTALTLNGLGHRVWSEATGRRLRITPSKTYDICKELIEKLPAAERKPYWDSFADLKRIIDFGKACGYVPSNHYERAKRIFDDEFFHRIEDKLEDWQEDFIREATLAGIARAMKGDCDYGDQLFMPTIFQGVYPRYPLILVDEAQDLSALNHATLRKLVGNRRLIAVGDARQAIYGFRGAHEDGMNKLREDFSMRELELSVSFRCAKSIVKAAHWRAPQMKWPDWAKEGSVRSLTSWGAADVPEDAAIICRNNAPLFACAIRLLKNGRTAELGGKDIVATLTKIMRKFGGSDLPQYDLLSQIERWAAAEKEKTKSRAHGRIDDQAECMRIFAREGKDLGEALAYAQHIAHLNSPLKLMTGHKSKGLEFQHVFFLDEHLISGEDQDPNVRYVIQTRAKETLTYVRSEDFHDN